MPSVLYALSAHGSDVAGLQPPSTETLVVVVLVAAATVAGAWLARRGSDRSALLAAASGILLIIAVLDLLPDAWDQEQAAGTAPWAVPVTALVLFGAMGSVVRLGCPCQPGRGGGIGAICGLALHRFLEGRPWHCPARSQLWWPCWCTRLERVWRWAHCWGRRRAGGRPRGSRWHA
ncbi:MAG: DUF1109 family protein [Hyphomicrobiales bacterium]|nr:MAG: DUF1109 family protein [Hyphomicrobiales bacterium]